MENVRPTALIILDGYGIGNPGPDNAIYTANTPVMDKLLANCPHTQLSASGLDVGLPEGQMGNSEVGHTNIGAGRVVYQDLPRITNAVKDGSFFENPAYVKAMDDALAKGADAFVIGDCSYDLMQRAQSLGLTLVDAGHFPTENPIAAVFAEQIVGAFPQVRTMVSERHADCIQFV